MQEVFLKIEDLKNKIIKLLNEYNIIKEENLNLKEKIISLEEKLELCENKFDKQNVAINKSENVEKGEVKEKLEVYIREIDELINILS